MIYAVFIGGGFGAVLRYLLSLLFLKYNMILPFQTLSANFIGCFIAGVAICIISLKSGINPVYKSLIITGFCGGLTTFSTFSLENIEMIQSGDYLKACFYIFLSLFICLFSTALAIFLVKKFI